MTESSFRLSYDGQVSDTVLHQSNLPLLRVFASPWQSMLRKPGSAGTQPTHEVLVGAAPRSTRFQLSKPKTACA